VNEATTYGARGMKKRAINFLVITILLISVIFMQQQLLGDEYEYFSRGKRDPFIPLVTSEIRSSLGLNTVESIEDIELEGIIFDPTGSSLAVLNGEIVKEGDKMENVEIVKIYANGVTVKLYEKIHTISLIEEGGEIVER
jgi:hypothetical protein